MSSAPHVIVGAGPVGSSLARILAGDGEPVIVVTRSGSELGGDGIRSIAADASDPEALTRIASGAAAIYNCANPGSYTQWERLWPPLGSALLTAAESTGAVLVTMSNLYGYGPVTEPMTAQMPLNPTDHKGALRARMWEEARAAHEAGRIRATEARASDYIGPTLPAASGLLARYAQATLVGKPASVFADPDVPHAWTAIDDVARTLVMLGRDERAWGRPWLVPSNPPVSVREALRRLSAAGRRSRTATARRAAVAAQDRWSRRPAPSRSGRNAVSVRCALRGRCHRDRADLRHPPDELGPAPRRDRASMAGTSVVVRPAQRARGCDVAYTSRRASTLTCV